MLLGLILSLFLADPAITGVVRDTSGAVVSGASVFVRTDSGQEEQAITDSDGRFAIEKAPAGRATLVVLAGGFAERQQPISGSGPIEVVLSVATVLETVTVTPTRAEQPLGDTPASVSVLTSSEIKASPAVVADDVLREIPTFSLFRRSNSLSTHPTSQGVSLRGIGPSGVSRTLVLLDGVPFNDPFGGWVYWTRVPIESADRIEVVEGSGSSLYGNYAMGGVINIVTGAATRRTLDLKPQFGSRDSPKLDVAASDVWGKLGVVFFGSVFRTDGFPIVAAAERGPIDINASVNYKNFTTKLDYPLSDRANVFFRGGYFTENRSNGKVGEVNDTQWTSGNGGIRLLLPDGSAFEGRAFLDFQRFHSTFMAVTNSTTLRNFDRLSVDQHVPTDSVGSLAQWSKSLGRSNMLSAGGDWRWVKGDSHEDSYNAATPQVIIPPVTIASVLALQRVSGGTQQIGGAFVQDVLNPWSRLTITLSARADYWQNYNAHNLETAVIPGTPVNNQPNLAGRTDTAVSPHAGALYHLSDRVSVWGAVGSGFRAPTLNELYRQFRVGTVLTLANNQLGPERLVGGEAGINIAPASNITWRTTWYDNRITDPVANVTLSTTPSTTTQQRQNLGSTRIWGLQSAVDYRPTPSWRFSGAYLYNVAKVTDGGAANAALVGNFLPEVPKNRGTLQVAYTSPKLFAAALSVQFYGKQFDDDQNVRAVLGPALAEAGYPTTFGPGLPGYTMVDLTVSRVVTHNLEVFFGVQNLFNEEYFVATLPDTIGTPRLVNGGVRLHFAGK